MPSAGRGSRTGSGALDSYVGRPRGLTVRRPEVHAAPFLHPSYPGHAHAGRRGPRHRIEGAGGGREAELVVLPPVERHLEGDRVAQALDHSLRHGNPVHLDDGSDATGGGQMSDVADESVGEIDQAAPLRPPRSSRRRRWPPGCPSPRSGLRLGFLPGNRVTPIAPPRRRPGPGVPESATDLRPRATPPGLRWPPAPRSSRRRRPPGHPGERPRRPAPPRVGRPWPPDPREPPGRRVHRSPHRRSRSFGSEHPPPSGRCSPPTPPRAPTRRHRRPWRRPRAEGRWKRGSA